MCICVILPAWQWKLRIKICNKCAISNLQMTPSNDMKPGGDMNPSGFKLSGSNYGWCGSE